LTTFHIDEAYLPNPYILNTPQYGFAQSLGGASPTVYAPPHQNHGNATQADADVRARIAAFPYPMYPNGAFNHTGYPPPDIDPAFLPPPTLDPMWFPQPPQHHHTPAAPYPVMDPRSYPHAYHHPQYHTSTVNCPLLPPPNVDPALLSQPNPSQLSRGRGYPTPAPPAAAAMLPATAANQIPSLDSLLDCSIDRFPRLDWIISKNFSQARQLIAHDSPSPINYRSLAVDPPVHNLRIGTRMRDTPLGQAFHRWGFIEVKKNHYITVGDVLYHIWAYFYELLTESDKGALAMAKQENALVDRFCIQRSNAQDLPLHDRQKRRCDTLYEWSRYAGLVVDTEFSRTRLLCLTLEKENS